MEFIKRKNICGICTSSLWWIPTLTYLNFKLVGTVNQQKEWVWWVGIATMFLIWVLMNWKIKLKKNDI
jgi:hypothetical protein